MNKNDWFEDWGDVLTKMMRQRILIVMFVIFSMMITVPNVLKANTTSENKLVYFIPVEDNVERGLTAFLVRATMEAVDAGANHIVFEIDTPGGFTDAASKIGTLIQGLEIPTTSYIVNEALSAGSYIALHTDTIYMKPNATMGASGVITGDGNAADQKAQSAWIAAMRGAAEAQGRDPLYAEAMANPDIVLQELGVKGGEFLTLTANDAFGVNYAEGIVKNRVELLYELGLSDARIVDVETTFAEGIARFVTSPIVIPILLSIASLGLILELYSPGFGVAGTMGLISLGLFFYGHMIAGLAGMETVILLLVGIVLIVLEFFVTGGILGIIGVSAIVLSLFLAGYDIGHMSLSISIALVVAIVAAIILYRWIGAERGIFKELILREQTTTELGYVSNETRNELIGVKCITATPLRPAGAIFLDDEKIDVVSDGDFIEKGQQVVVTHVEGMRVVVRKV